MYVRPILFFEIWQLINYVLKLACFRHHNSITHTFVWIWISVKVCYEKKRKLLLFLQLCQERRRKKGNNSEVYPGLLMLILKANIYKYIWMHSFKFPSVIAATPMTPHSEYQFYNKQKTSHFTENS